MDVLPRFHGVAWRRMDRDTAVTAIIPLNIVLAVAYSSWLWLRHFGASRWLEPGRWRRLRREVSRRRVREREQRELAYRSGYDSGVRHSCAAYRALIEGHGRSGGTT